MLKSDLLQIRKNRSMLIPVLRISSMVLIPWIEHPKPLAQPDKVRQVTSDSRAFLKPTFEAIPADVRHMAFAKVEMRKIPVRLALKTDAIVA